MADADEIQKLLAPVEAAFRAEFSRGHNAGYAEGYKAALVALMQTAQSLSPFPTPGSVVPQEFNLTEIAALDNESPWVPRAPKGLLDQVLDTILTVSPGLTTQQVEVAAVAMDPRIAVKSVYNRLRHFEKSGRKFRRVDGKWFRIADIPPPWAGMPPSQEELIERLGTRHGAPNDA